MTTTKRRLRIPTPFLERRRVVCVFGATVIPRSTGEGLKRLIWRRPPNSSISAHPIVDQIYNVDCAPKDRSLSVRESDSILNLVDERDRPWINTVKVKRISANEDAADINVDNLLHYFMGYQR